MNKPQELSQLENAVNEMGYCLTPEHLDQIYQGDCMTLINEIREEKKREYIAHTFPFVTSVLELYRRPVSKIVALTENLKGNLSILPLEVLITKHNEEVEANMKQMSISDLGYLLHTLKKTKIIWN